MSDEGNQKIFLASADDISKAIYGDYGLISGPANKLAYTLTALRAREGPPGKDLPGWIDNLTKAMEEEDNVIYRKNRAGRIAYGRWYESGEDGSVASLLLNYLRPFIEFGGAVYQTHENEIDETEAFIQKLKDEQFEVRLKAKKMEQETKEESKKEPKRESPPQYAAPGMTPSSFYHGISGAFDTTNLNLITNEGMENILKCYDKIIGRATKSFDNALKSKEETEKFLFKQLEEYYGNYIDTQNRFLGYAILSEQQKANEIVRSNTIDNMRLDHTSRVKDFLLSSKDQKPNMKEGREK